jgi:hypothetical protein
VAKDDKTGDRLSPLARRRAEAARAIRAAPPKEPEYVHSIFSQTYLPVADPGEDRAIG